MKSNIKSALAVVLIALLVISPSIVFAYERNPNVKTDLSVNIVRPKEGFLYFHDKEIIHLPLGNTRIIGKVTIKVDVSDSTYNIDHVDLYLDGDLKGALPGPYYEYMLDQLLFSKHKLKAVAYNTNGDSAESTLDFSIICPGLRIKAPAHPEVGEATQSNTDGYNYHNYKDGVRAFVYNQLWYFNFLDDNGTSTTADDISGVAAYGLANPENLSTGGAVTNAFGMIVRDTAEGASFPLFSDNYDPTVAGNFYASETFEPGAGFELQNPGGTIDVISPDHYHIQGNVVKGDKQISWELDYERSLGGPWLPWVHWPVPKTLGLIPAWITYHMQMANAVVNGTFYVRDGANETTYVLNNAKGYHDGFYSEFVFSIMEWNWVDYKQDDLSVQMLYPHAPLYSCKDGWETCTPGNLRVVYKNGSATSEYNFYRRCDLDKAEISVTYGPLATDPAYPNVSYPTTVYISAFDTAGNRLELQWSLVRYMTVYFDVPAPFYDTVTFEIIANFTGTFYEASSGTTVAISGPGWSDWSGPAFPQG